MHLFAILSVLTVGFLCCCDVFISFDFQPIVWTFWNILFSVFAFYLVCCACRWFDVHWSLAVCNKNGCLLSSSQSQPLQRTYRRPVLAGVCVYDDSEEEDDEFGYGDPLQDDLYARKVGLMPQPSVKVPFDKFLPKFWTPEEDAHVKKIKLGSQCRPWYRKIQGFRSVQYWGKKREKTYCK